MADGEGSGTTPPARLLTEDPGAFAATLWPGDVLLFDTLNPVSWLVKLFEDRPVSHAAVYLGDGTYAEMGLPQYADEQRTRILVHPARATPLDRVLTKPQTGPWALVRTVTALRHRQIGSPAHADPVVEVARAYIDADPHYDYTGLLALALPSMLRSYGTSFHLAQHLGILGAPLEAVADAIVAALVEETAAPDGVSLTCSEFVFRCFAEAPPVHGPKPLIAPPDLTPTIADPLFRWKDPLPPAPPAPPSPPAPPAAPGGPEAGGPVQWFSAPRLTVGDPGTDIWDRLEFDGDLRDHLLDEPTTGFGGEQLTASFGGGAAFRLAVDAFKRLIETNVLHGKHGQVPIPPAGSTFADTVTPRDLWGSASFSVVAVLHRPPGPDDRLLAVGPPSP